MSPFPQKPSVILVLSASIGTAGWVGIGLLDVITLHPVVFVLLYAVAFFAYLAAVKQVLDQPQAWWALTLILLIGLLFRALVFSGTPSDDIYRYLWEGAVQRTGLNPYALAPDSPELEPLREVTSDYSMINHKSWSAIYPPLTMLWHRLFGYNVVMLKASFLFAEGILVLFLWLLLKVRHIAPERVLIYWWNPLPILSFSLEGHHDAISLALLMGAFYALMGLNKNQTALLGWTAAVLTKGFALAAGPAFWNRIKPVTWIWALIFGVVASLPFLDAGPALWRSLLRFGGDMHYNDSLHALFAIGVRSIGIETPLFSRVLSVIFWIGILMWVMTKVRPDPLLRAAWLVAALLLVLPTVHPWYMITLLPFLCFFPWPGWLFLMGSAILPFLAQLEIAHTGEWEEWHGVKIFEYAPLFGWFLWMAYKRRHARTRSVSSLPPDHHHEVACQ